MSLANHSPFDSLFILIYIRMLHVLHMSCHGNVLCNFTIVLPIHNVVGQSRSILKYICCVCCMCSQDAVMHLKTVVKIKKTAFGDPSTEVQCSYTTLPRIQREDVCHVTELFHYVDFCHVSLCQPITVRGFSPVAGHNLSIRRRCSKCREAP